MSDIALGHDGGSTTIDYELDDRVSAETPERMKALGHPLRQWVCDLVLERAMTVSELAERTGRPRGTVAHHVQVLVDAGLLKVVRTRRVRAIEERFYGRTARTFVIEHTPNSMPFLDEALAHLDFDRDDTAHGCTFRHARIEPERANEYAERLHALALEFSGEQRSGDTEFGLLFYLFPTKRQAQP